MLHPARRGLRPARPGRRPACARWPARPTSRPAAPRSRAVAVAPEVLGYVVDLVPGHPAVAVAAARRLAARRHRAAARRPGVGLAVRPRLRHARRRQGAGPAGAAPPRRSCGPRPSSRASPPTRVLDGVLASVPVPALSVAGRGADRTGRRCWPLLGVAGRGCSRRPGRRLLARGRRCSLVAGRASTSRWPARSARLRLRPRRATAPVRLGEPADGRRCSSTNPAGAPVRGRLRDAWPPSRRAPTARGTALDVPAGRAPAARHRRCARPGAATGAADRVTVRSLGPLGLAAPAGRRTRCRGRCGCCRRSRRASTCPPKLARLRELDGRTAVDGPRARAPSSTRCASTSSATTSARSTGGPPPGAATSWCAPGGPSATAGSCSCSTPAAPSAGRVGDAPAAGRARWTRPCCSAALAARAGDRVDLLAYDRRVRARRRGRAGDRPAAALVHGDGAARGRRWSSPTPAGMVAAVLARRRRRCLVVLLTALDAGAVEEGLLPVLPR